MNAVSMLRELEPWPLSEVATRFCIDCGSFTQFVGVSCQSYMFTGGGRDGGWMEG
jgi:hypothetical protein